MSPRYLAGPSTLFVPADRPDRYSKAMDHSDSTIFDLEDAVTPSRKQEARECLRSWCEDPVNESVLEGETMRVVVRINATSSEFFAEDVEFLRTSGVPAVMLPKTESPNDVERLSSLVPGVSVIALCETPMGIARSLDIAEHPAVSALMWGSEDLMATLGGTSSRLPDGRFRDVARQSRSAVLLHAAAHGKSTIDTVYTDLSNEDGLLEESRDAAGSGFTLKACIHPAQCGTVRQAFSPAADEVAYARDLLAAVKDSRGAARFRGKMVDEPLIRNAEQVLQRAAAVE